jgi:alpha 1,2-mannosyltransferase
MVASLDRSQLSPKLLFRVALICILLYLISPWLLPHQSGSVITTTRKSNTKIDGFKGLEPELFASKIVPLKNDFPSYGDALAIALPEDNSKRWTLIHKVFAHYNPGTPLETSFANVDKKQLYIETWETCERPNLVHIDSQHIIKARKKHSAFVEHLPALAHAFSYPENTRGIVTTAGGELMPRLLVGLRMLRRTGSSLPVEVFLNNMTDYEPQLCSKVLPTLGAKCVLLGHDMLDGTTPKGASSVTMYQVKPFAVLFSSFNEVLFMDADNFPVTDPEHAFKSKPFRDTGLVIWPDLWCASQSRLFYQIAGTSAPSIKDRPGSESGQLMYNKNKHLEDLLLACYYNYHGPKLWWPLLSQGFPGEGDKETYLASALVMNASFYQARQVPGMLPEEYNVDFAMKQVNLIEDFAATQAETPLSELKSPTAFIHHHYPRLDAVQIIQRDDYEWAKEGKHDRMWGSKEKTEELFGFDLEHEVWKAINYTACGIGHMFRAWEKEKSPCSWITEHMRTVFNNSKSGSMENIEVRDVQGES